jgi:hypothetical protein
MRLALAAFCIAAFGLMAWAQTEPNLDQLSASQPLKGEAPQDKKGEAQSLGSTGPLTTGSGGGASPTNPQGGTPPNMQVAPDSSSKTTGDQK